MNNDKINQWLTTIANFGVIAGIDFLVIEVRQSSTQIEQSTEDAGDSIAEFKAALLNV